MCFRERNCSKKILQTDASGCFIIGKDSTPMKLWQHADTGGKLRYSLLPVLDASKTERDKSILNVSSLVSTESDSEQSNNQRISSCNVSRDMDSLMNLHKVVIDGYACSKCDMKFPMKSMMHRHKRTHNMRSKFREKHWKQRYIRHVKINARKRPGRSISRKRSEKIKLVCTLCDFSCNRSTTLAAHVKRKHKTKKEINMRKFRCTICGCEYSNEIFLNKHMRKHKSKNMTGFACNVCDFECKRSTTLSSHLARKHKKPKKSPNSRSKTKQRRITKRNYASSKKTRLSAVGSNAYKDSNMLIKEEVDTDDNGTLPKITMNAMDQSKKSGDSKIDEIRCDLCDFTCTKKRTLYSHKRRHKEDEVYACNECLFKTCKKSSLYSHIKRKHKEPRACDGDAQQPELFHCSQCDYKNKNKYELKVHVARKHSDDFKFSCETCGKKFKVKGDLTNHIRFSHREQPVICDVCGKTCLNSNSLYVHQKFAHYKAKYECQVCKRRMVSQENLNEHMLRQHERRENVVCEECGKTFSRNSRLKVHMRIHTGDKPYSCTVCNKAFARRTALKQHLLIHTGVRPYVCDICGKAFTQKPGLISHRKSHPGSHPPLPRVLIDHILNDVMKP